MVIIISSFPCLFLLDTMYVTFKNVDLRQEDYVDIKTMILLSSIVTWQAIPRDPENPDEVFTEELAVKRLADPAFEHILEIEKMMHRKPKRDNLRTFVIHAGIPYGMEEDWLHPWFKVSSPLLFIVSDSVISFSNLLVFVQSIARLLFFYNTSFVMNPFYWFGVGRFLSFFPVSFFFLLFPPVSLSRP